LGGLATGGKSAGLIMRIVLLACLALVGLTSGGHGLEDRYAGLHRLGRRELALDRLLRVNLLTGPLFIVGACW
jgi:hypothetical protein